MKIYINPHFTENDQETDGGIRRVVTAQRKWLPKYGYEIVDNPSLADIINVHAGALVSGYEHIPRVASTHGLYWNLEEPDWKEWAIKYNEKVLTAMRKAEVVTTPSNWVAHAVQRGMLIDPITVYHGINPDEWEIGENKGYVLWNKTRPDPTCRPGDMNGLAELALDIPFVSTFGDETDNVEIINAQPYGVMKKIIAGASVYLATARETFGIGTLEAMACGVPVIGWDWGGQAEIIETGVQGILVPPGDYHALRDALHQTLANRKEMGEQARLRVLRHFTWEKVIHGYIEAYELAYKEFHRETKVTIVVPCYNQAEYLPDCVKSVQEQNLKEWELIIVDDKSPDNTSKVADTLAASDDRIKVIHNKTNLYLAEARNTAFRIGEGKYFLPLDADDRLAPDALSLMVNHLEDNQHIHITYGALRAINTVTGDDFISGWPLSIPPDYVKQINEGKNQIPYSSMYRRRVFFNLGGYRRRMHNAEDAEFWSRAFSYGYQPERATKAVTLIKNEHPDSMGYTKKPVDWNAWYTWRDKEDLTPFGCIHTFSDRKIGSYNPTLISVVIPVRAGHDYYLQDALDSLLAQTYPYWEVIIVNDGDQPFTDDDDKVISKYLAGFPFVRIVEGIPGQPQGPAWARNQGASVAKGPLLVFLDADDYLQPLYLELCLKAIKKVGGYAYTDWYAIGPDNEPKEHLAADWNSKKSTKQMISSMTIMIPKNIWQEVGGLDENIKGWEDWDFFLSLLEAGYCGVRVAMPLFTYRFYTGMRREESYARKDELLQEITFKHDTLYKGDLNIMGCSKCPGGQSGRSTLYPSNAAYTQQQAEEGTIYEVEYIGPRGGSHRVKSTITGQSYKFNNTGIDKRVFIRKEDVAFFEPLVDYSIIPSNSEVSTGGSMPVPLVTHETSAPLRDNYVDTVSSIISEAQASLSPAPPDINVLRLTAGIENSLRAENINTVADLEILLNHGRDYVISSISGIGATRYDRLVTTYKQYLHMAKTVST